MTATTPTVRERIVTSAAELIQQRGVSGVGLREVVAHADAPRGSLQHYFPGGKAQLVHEAMHHADRVGGRVLRRGLAEGDSGPELLARWCAWWRRRLVSTDFAAGCPLIAAVADGYATSDVGQVFAAWQIEAATVLIGSGHSRARATSLASVLVAAVEGAVILARAERSLAPLDAVERELTPLFAT